ncbi:MAG TPA: metallophosphoesterase [Gammaproteobacteria bacterium]|nr:metallophosphoesterase [Gammaproteobacteria bacterium]
MNILAAIRALGLGRITKTGALFAFLLASSIGLSACGGGGGTTATTGDSGDVFVALTDARGDFASYTVDVMSLSLTTANGTVVETLPISTRVDFAQYTDMTEFLTIATIPKGIYVQGSITLDYSNADIWVEDANGNAIQVSNIVDGNGNPVSQIEMTVQLDGQNQLRIAPGIPAHLTMDFDLKASNTVTFDAQDVPTISVQPFLLAAVDATNQKTHRVRGPLKQVIAESDKFQLYIRPFRHRMSNPNARSFGVLTVKTDAQTLFEVDGVKYQGSAGIDAMALLPARSAVIAQGKVHINLAHFKANIVYAGSSVSGGNMDVVHGSVIARTGNTLSMRGATLIRADGTVSFNDTVRVTLADSTIVSKQLDSADHTISEISVGQRLTVFGVAVMDASNALSLDASNGYARMVISSVNGHVSGSAFLTDSTLPLVMNASLINGRNVSLYDFTGTGIDSANDANPASYEITTGTLDVSGLTDLLAVSVRGFPTAFGSAPNDFVAQTIINRSQPQALPQTP